MKPKKITPYPLYNTDNPLLTDHAKELDIFLNKPFWICDREQHKEQTSYSDSLDALRESLKGYNIK